jgi:site-specific recombinase XerD
MINIPCSMTPDGRRIRRFFPTRDDARGFAEKIQAQYKNEGVAALGLSGEERVMATKSFDLLRDAGMDDLLKVVQEGIKSIDARKKSRPFGEVFDDFIASKNRSEIYKKSLERSRKRLGNLADVVIADVTPELLESNLVGLKPTYRNALLREIRAVFEYAIRRKWCAENPVKCMDFESHAVGEREVFSVEECAKLLNTCAARHGEMLAGVAIGLFAGVRIFEILRLKWENVDLTERMIDLPSEITKRKRKRSIPVEPALLAWLRKAIRLGAEQKGQIMSVSSYNQFRDRIRELSKDADVKWKQNAMRHSYASYWLEQNKDLTKLALFLGHTGGLDVLHRFYHRSVRARDAKRFWSLRPVDSAKKGGNRCQP